MANSYEVHMLRSLLLWCLAVAVPAAAAPTFDPLPPNPNEAPSGLLIRVVRYEGATNGGMLVEVKNPTAEPIEFVPGGLFFVPEVDPDRAPQRLGAVGSFQLKGKREHKVRVDPSRSLQLGLDVYCIDSHRSSPSSRTPFRVGKERMPRELSQAINDNSVKASESYGGVHAAPAKDAVQGEVWKTRNQKWIKLDGESKQEANK